MKNNIGLVKRANRSIVIEAIMSNEVVTIEGIVRMAKLSRPTVLGILKDLTDENLVIKTGFAPSEVGRQAVLYSINSRAFYAMGIDIDGPPVRISISDVNGVSLFNTEFAIELTASGSQIAEMIIQNIDRSINEAGIEAKKIIGIGLGVPGVISLTENRIEFISRIKGCLEVSVNNLIEERTGVPVYVRNDAHLLSLAEYSLKKLSGDLIYVIHRSGIGSAQIVSGNLFTGVNGNAGYLGHSTINANGRQCDCGRIGCLETYCSKRAIVADYCQQTAVQSTYRKIVQFASDGDPVAVGVFAEAGRILGLGICNSIKMFDISTVIIGGLGCGEKHVFFKSICESIRKNTLEYMRVQPRVVLGKLDESEFGLGGCHYVLKRFFSLPTLKVSIE
ncbi:MAG: ROK family protein [Candidatus Pacebacteria bacterium]|nr:ROK family protein [Candidatus Paceibacterota bacterium]